MPIVQGSSGGIVFPDATPKDVIDVFMWAKKQDPKPIMKITMDDGTEHRGRFGAITVPNGKLYSPGIYTGTRNSSGFMVLETDKIDRIEYNNKQNGGVLYDGLPFESVLATSLSLQALATELKNKEQS
jgi:hypothetical protein